MAKRDYAIAGPDAAERIERVKGIRAKQAEQIRKLRARGMTREEIERWEEDQGVNYTIPEQHLEAAGMFTTNGVVYSSRQERDAVRDALAAAGMAHVYAAHLDAIRVLRAAGIE